MKGKKYDGARQDGAGQVSTILDSLLDQEITPLDITLFHALANTVNVMKGRTETLTIRLSPEIKAELEKLAAADRRPVSQYVALLIEDHVKAKQSSS